MDLKPLRILVVDDNRHAAEIVKSILAGVGTEELLDAPTAQRAFEILRAVNVDLVILDQNLGKGDEGTQLVRRIRNDPATPNPYIPILMLTGYTEHRRVVSARDAGVTEFLSKPFTIAGLLRRLEVLILQPRPFVRSADYFGPDRRRRADPNYQGPDRRKRS